MSYKHGGACRVVGSGVGCCLGCFLCVGGNSRGSKWGVSCYSCWYNF